MEEANPICREDLYFNQHRPNVQILSRKPHILEKKKKGFKNAEKRILLQDDNVQSLKKQISHLHKRRNPTATMKP